jgi:regulatory protein
VAAWRPTIDGAVRARPVSLRAQAIRLLARREYARAELAQRLGAKGAQRDEVNAVLDELVALGHLSDARYAQAFAAQKQKAYSRTRITNELKSRGVARGDIDAALAQVDIDEEAALRALWERRFGRPPANEREKARQVRLLQARGFLLSAILKLLRQV